MERELLKKTTLFQGLDDSKLQSALAFFDARESAYEKGDLIKPVHAPFTRFALVLQGRVQVYTDDLSGNQMMMAHVEKGGMFGESLSFLEQEEAVYAVAVTACRILWLHPGNIRRLQPQSALETTLIHRFIQNLAARALSMNDRIQILSKLTLEEKLRAFLSLYQKRRGNEFVIPFSRTELATYLGANRSALSRALSQMQKKGLITLDGRRITLHSPMES
ncbi:MAG: Crp/Fnr family transcriptional regulator [Clostridia bacterium]|nr:Crp/Fnr family transcriptional regulator [Clostridia bacterium]